MFPELFHFSLPDFLSSIFGIQEVTIYSYAVLIALGTLLAGIYTKWRAKKELGIINLSNTFFYNIFIAGFVGGKLFYYRSEEHTSELQSRENLVCRLLLEKK